MRPTLLSGVSLAVLLGISAAHAQTTPAFNRIATFNVVDNLPADADPKKGTVAEIITASEDGKTLVYTDSPGNRIGFVDINDPAAPKAAGVVALGGEPTSTVIIKDKAFVGVVTSESKAKPSGHLAVVDLATKKVVATCDLGGQPDLLARSDDGSFLAIAIENERDEEINEGAIPQLPGGNLTYFPVKDGAVACADQEDHRRQRHRRRRPGRSGAGICQHQRPEPGRADAPGEQPHRGRRSRHRQDRRRTSPPAPPRSTMSTPRRTASSTCRARRRRPRASRTRCTGSTMTASSPPMKATGRAAPAASPSMTRPARCCSRAVRRRSTWRCASATIRTSATRRASRWRARKPRPSAATSCSSSAPSAARWSSSIATRAAPTLPNILQALPGGIGPEGLLAIPARDLLVTASETDLREEGGIGSVVTIYKRGNDKPAYPTIASVDGPDGLPIWWSALSGFAADRQDPGQALHRQ